MKIIQVALILLLTFSVSCKKDEVTDPNGPKAGYTRSDGFITGADFRKCACCGGWFTAINQDTLRIFNMPASFDSTLMTKTLPVQVTLDWKKLTEGCGSSMADLIEVDAIKMK